MKNIFLLLLILAGFNSYGQSSTVEYRLSLNGNIYFPMGEANQGVYPILWYDQDADPKVLLGGVGLGFSASKAIGQKLAIQAQSHLSKHTYWDEPIIIRTADANLLSPFVSGSSDYTIRLLGILDYSLNEKISIGTGMGFQGMLISLSRLPETAAVNRFYKPILPVVPLELSLNLNKYFVKLRYEQGIINKYRKPLAEYKKANFGILFFEFGSKVF